VPLPAGFLEGALADLKRSVRNSLRYFQTVRAPVASLVQKSFR
jgi:hypothetical protein